MRESSNLLSRAYKGCYLACGCWLYLIVNMQKINLPRESHSQEPGIGKHQSTPFRTTSFCSLQHLCVLSLFVNDYGVSTFSPISSRSRFSERWEMHYILLVLSCLDSFQNIVCVNGNIFAETFVQG